MDKTPVKIHLFSIEESLGFALNVYEMVYSEVVLFDQEVLKQDVGEIRHPQVDNNVSYKSCFLFVLLWFLSSLFPALIDTQQTPTICV